MNHRRYNPLREEWVIVAANRVNRPWQGATEADTKTKAGFTTLATINPLAPGGKRANGKTSPHYTSTYVFENDFPSLTDDGNRDEDPSELVSDQLYQSHTIRAMNHRRYNPLREEWVIVAANRVNRPWQGATEADTKTKAGFTTLATINPLAPGGKRANGKTSPYYTSTYVFENDFPSLTDDGNRDEDPSELVSDQLYQSHTIRGTCRVLCYHPDSELSMARMSKEQIEAVIDLWIAQMDELQSKYEWVQIFENKGAVVGCSNPHPHGQLWASNFLPTYPAKEYNTQKAYKERTGKVMLMEVLKHELEVKERVVVENDEWVVVIPFWATWPFETMLLPKKHVISLNEINPEQKRLLADIIRKLLIKYDNLFQCSFPFSMGWQSAPTGRYLQEDRSFWTLRAVYLPPLLRSATVRKFMAGYELVSEPQRDITPEKVSLYRRSS
uniref:Galactose-1-phosphate uridylyltransferase n=1 Tax=Ascaris lumbricoides TaxID=6252 RepID=A0A0M3IH82_ASCLU